MLAAGTVLSLADLPLLNLLPVTHPDQQVVHDQLESTAKITGVPRAILGEHLVRSSEVEESVFEKIKSLERDQSSSGLTRYVLSRGALIGDWTTSRIKKNQSSPGNNSREVG